MKIRDFFTGTRIALILIVLFGFFLRFYNIENNPKGIYGDELTLVYDAYSLLKTGMDQTGESWPLLFKLGGSRPPVYVYATIPFVAVFGPSALAVRAVSALSGTGLIVALYFLGKFLLNKKVALWVAFFTAISPWSLGLSRAGFETNFALFLATLGTLAFIKGIKSYRWYFICCLLFALSIQTYPTYRLIIPIFFLFLILQNISFKPFFSKLKNPVFIFGTLIFILSFALSLFLTFGKIKEDRFSTINIFTNQEIKEKVGGKIILEKRMDQLPPAFTALLHNHLVEFIGVMLDNYSRNFSTDFLFLTGDKSPRHNPVEAGQLYWADAILIGLGLIFLAKRNLKILVTLLAWFLIAPLATAFVGSPHALRSSFMLAPALLIAAFGAYKIQLMKRGTKKAALVILLLISFLIQFIFLIDRVYFLSANKNYSFWSYSAKQSALIALKNKDKYDAVFLSNNIPDMEFAYPVYAKLDPKLVIGQNKHQAYVGDFRFFKYDNVYIGSVAYGALKEFIKSFPGTVLFVGLAGKEQPYLENYDVIKEPDNIFSLVVVSKHDSYKPDITIK